MLNINIDDLENLHLHNSNDVGRRGNREEKKKLCTGILDKNQRLNFYKAYDELIREVIAPSVSSVHNCEILYIQAFPWYYYYYYYYYYLYNNNNII